MHIYAHDQNESLHLESELASNERRWHIRTTQTTTTIMQN